MPAIAPRLTLAVVGDIHDQWEAEDAIALEKLGVDLVLFVGDFGNESLETVRQIATLPLPKASIFGNHDAWYTATPWGRRRRPYNPQEEDRFQQQLEILSDFRVGFGRKDFPALGLSVVGSRPFSWGGPHWINKTFYRERFGVGSFEDSTRRMVEAGLASEQPTLLMMGHNGPAGLGNEPEDICGKDWKLPGQDYGDPDFAAAIAQLKTSGNASATGAAQRKSIPLVTFGHMHHGLRHRQDRLRTSWLFQNDTLYLNAARCPRIVEREGQRLRNFSLVTLEAGQVQAARLVWVTGAGAIVSTELLYDAASPDPSTQTENPALAS